MFCNQSNVSENLQSAYDICQELTTNELLELAVYMGKKNKTVMNADEWATAIAGTLENRCPNTIHLN